MKVFAIDLLEQIENEIKIIEEEIKGEKSTFYDAFYQYGDMYRAGFKKGLEVAHNMIYEKMYEEDGARNYKINSKVCKA